jgi:hypothetical protein
MSSFGMQQKDFEVGQSPPDTVSALAFSTQQDYLAASCWDNQVFRFNKDQDL